MTGEKTTTENLPRDRIWRDIEGGAYAVSDCGDVVNTKTGNWLGYNGHGYSLVTIRREAGHIESTSVHRLVYETFVGKIPKGLEINHIDGNKRNNRLSNLELCTSRENSLHALRTGLWKPKKGEDHPLAKLAESDVLDIYTLIKQGYGNAEIAALYDLDRSYINCIRSGTRWQELYTSQKMVRIPSFDKTKIPLPSRVSLYEKCKFTDIPDSKIAKEFGLSRSTVNLIRHGKIWKAFSKFYNLQRGKSNET